MVIVYTAILGDCDSLKPAPAGADRCVCFVDDLAMCNQDSRGWTLQVHPKAPDPRREAWRLRCVPHQIFDAYDTVVWIDASFTLTNLPLLLQDSKGHDLSALRHQARVSCYEEGREVVRIGQSDEADVARQMAAYRQDGFTPSQLSISCIIVRAHTPKVSAFNERWAAEIQQHPGDNTQLSIDYCAWKTGVGMHHLQGVRKDNPYAVHDHRDHKRRRRPYR
jgi:hypothetical protein